MGDYITSNNFKTFNNIPTSDTQDDTAISAAISAASRAIETYCHRSFEDSGSASARVYKGTNYKYIFTDDFNTTTGLVIKFDTGDNGSFDKTLVSADYEVYPYNSRSGGIPNYPYYRIDMTNDDIPCTGDRPRVQVTAQWGWSAVPSEITEACYLLASEYFFSKNAPFGVAGIQETGYAITVRSNPMVRRLLDPFRKPNEWGVA